jgi:hypothetical protein
MSARESTSSAPAPRAPLHSLKLSLTFWSILSVGRPQWVIRPGEARCTQEEEPTMDHTFPDLDSLTDPDAAA